VRRDDSDVIIQKSPRNWRVSEVETSGGGGDEPALPPARSPRRTATESAAYMSYQAPKELPAARPRMGTQYRPKLSAEARGLGSPFSSIGTGGPAGAPAPGATSSGNAAAAAAAAMQRHGVQVVSDASRHRVKAYKHFLFEYYSGWFKYLNQRKARMEKLEREMRLMPGDSGQAHKAEHLRKESQYLRQRRRKMRLGEFQILALLGKGAFGAVYLARKRDTGEVVAVKKISKQQYDASNKDRVLREKKVLQVAAASPWLVGLSYAFQDKDFLYLAMEYVPGGDLRGLLRNIGCLEESMAAFYLVEMIACVAALHALGYTHRDL
jgi:cell cycle protein kinase DBF2